MTFIGQAGARAGGDISKGESAAIGGMLLTIAGNGGGVCAVRHRLDVDKVATRPPSPVSPAWSHGGFLACLVLLALPVAAVRYPPLFDYANHLARAHVLGQLESSAVFQAHFVGGGFLIPNVLADVVVLALSPAVGVPMAGKLLLVLTFVLTLGGAYGLNRQLAGGFSPWPLLCAAVLYNEDFFWGFLNYNLGLGLMLCALAWRCAARSRRVRWRMAGDTVCALAILFAHLVAFGLYAIAVAVLELCWLVRQRPGWRAAGGRLAAAAGPLLVPPLLFAALSPSAELALAAGFDFSVFGKIMPFARLLSSGNPALDVACAAALVAGVAGALAAGVARLIGGLALVAGLYLVLVLTLPFSLLGSFFLDSRIIVAVALVFLAALAPGRGMHPGWVAGAIVLLVGARSVGLTEDWRRQDQGYAQVVATLDTVPAGSVIVTAVGYGFELGDWVTTRRVKPAHEHTTLYATIRRDALVPNIFARPGQNPLVFRSPLEALNRAAANPVARVTEIGDARWMVQQVLPIADHRTEVQPPIPAVYVIGYRVPCEWWPADLPIRRVACTAEFSLIEVIGGVTEPLP